MDLSVYVSIYLPKEKCNLRVNLVNHSCKNLRELGVFNGWAEKSNFCTSLDTSPMGVSIFFPYNFLTVLYS